MATAPASLGPPAALSSPNVTPSSEQQQSSAAARQLFIVSVTIVQGRSLPKRDWSGSDPYCVVTVNDGKAQRSIGAIKWRTQNPIFNERFDFVCEAPPNEVVIALVDKERFVGDVPIGELRHTFAPAANDESNKFVWGALCPPRSAAAAAAGALVRVDDAVCGELQYSVTCVPQSAAVTNVQYIQSLGLTSIRLDQVSGLAEGLKGTRAAKLLGKQLARGEYKLRLVLVHGLRAFHSRSVPGVPLPMGRRKAAAVVVAPVKTVSASAALGGVGVAPHGHEVSAAHAEHDHTEHDPARGRSSSTQQQQQQHLSAPAAAAPNTAPAVPIHIGQDCRVWVKDGEADYVIGITLYAERVKPKRSIVTGTLMAAASDVASVASTAAGVGAAALRYIPHRHKGGSSKQQQQVSDASLDTVATGAADSPVVEGGGDVSASISSGTDADTSTPTAAAAATAGDAGALNRSTSDRGGVGSSSSSRDTTVELIPLGRGYLPSSVLQDGNVHEFRLALYEVTGAHDEEMTDKQQNSLLKLLLRPSDHHPQHHDHPQPASNAAESGAVAGVGATAGPGGAADAAHRPVTTTTAAAAAASATGGAPFHTPSHYYRQLLSHFHSTSSSPTLPGGIPAVSPSLLPVRVPGNETDGSGFSPNESEEQLAAAALARTAAAPQPGKETQGDTSGACAVASATDTQQQQQQQRVSPLAAGSTSGGAASAQQRQYTREALVGSESPSDLVEFRVLDEGTATPSEGAVTPLSEDEDDESEELRAISMPPPPSLDKEAHPPRALPHPTALSTSSTSAEATTSVHLPKLHSDADAAAPAEAAHDPSSSTATAAPSPLPQREWREMTSVGLDLSILDEDEEMTPAAPPALDGRGFSDTLETHHHHHPPQRQPSSASRHSVSSSISSVSSSLSSSRGSELQHAPHDATRPHALPPRVIAESGEWPPQQHSQQHQQQQQSAVARRSTTQPTQQVVIVHPPQSRLAHYAEAGRAFFSGLRSGGHSAKGPAAASAATDGGGGGGAAPAPANEPPPSRVVAELRVRAVFQPKERVEAWFFRRLLQEFDSNGDGVLDAAEASVMLEALGHHVNGEQMDDLLKRFDKNQDGSLETTELLAWLRSPEFTSLPMSSSLLAFLASGPRGLECIVNDVTEMVSRSDKGTRTGAGVAVILDPSGAHEHEDTLGLTCVDRATGLVGELCLCAVCNNNNNNNNDNNITLYTWLIVTASLC